MKKNGQKGIANIIMIIVGILVACILLGFFSEKKVWDWNIFSGGGSSDSLCGISVTSPLENQTISSPVLLEGSARGCGWDALGGVVGTAQIYDSNNNPISDMVPAKGPESVNSASPVKFQAVLRYNYVPASNTGYILIKHYGKNSSEGVITKSIPVGF